MRKFRFFGFLSLTLALAACVAAAATPAHAGPRAIGVNGKAFTFDWLKSQAKALAASDFEPAQIELPDSLQNLTYDQFRDIRFRPDQSIWKKEGLPFQLQFFHMGFFYKEPIFVHVVSGGKTQNIDFSTAMFDYGHNNLGQLSPDLGFAGFRVHYRLNRPEYFDELTVFLGASYFRALGKGQLYGLSARGLAIDTALPQGEEFPSFREFWIEKPTATSKELVVYALLDSRSYVGAYKFVIRPGNATGMDVTATLYPRREVEKLGIAPLTSMYLFGENDHAGFDDFRPEVHDSDGLFLWTGGGEQIWRPLSNPTRLRVSAFTVDDPRGFGLLQRDRAFSSYEDLESRYEKRPSVWVEPLSKWGKGTVQLVEIPATEEYHDNIVAFWTPDKVAKVGDSMSLSYRLWWGDGPPDWQSGEHTVATRIAAGSEPGSRRFVLDFMPNPTKEATAEAQTAEAVITVSSGQVIRPTAYRNEVTGGWRAFFEFKPANEDPVEMRAYLRNGTTSLTETWSYLWSP
jgi:glucans biosynthesis protein